MRALGRPDDSFRITGEFRVGDIRHARADIEAARRLLGWSPKVGIDEGLERLAQWAQSQHAAAQGKNGVLA
jgi:dTDP-L-rhamnose 4-epimerase